MQRSEHIILTRTYKDRLFRRLFNSKEDLLSLYNAVNDSHYTNPDDLEISYLDEAIYLAIEHDISFVISCELNLYERQSNILPNMPFRGFLYFAAQYKAIAEKANYALYSCKQLKLPTPRYIVLYNGEETQPERQELRLSDAFENQGAPGCLECVATALNINIGYNEKLHSACKTLHDYAILIEKIRRNRKNGLSIETSVNYAIEDCLRDNVLAAFLRKNRAETLNLIFTSYEQEEHLNYIRQETRDELMPIIEQQKLEITNLESIIQQQAEKLQNLKEMTQALQAQDTTINL